MCVYVYIYIYTYYTHIRVYVCTLMYMLFTVQQYAYSRGTRARCILDGGHPGRRAASFISF